MNVVLLWPRLLTRAWLSWQCILAYQEPAEEFQREHGEEVGLYKGRVPSPLIQRTIDRFRSIDPLSVDGHCYWPGTLDYI